VLVLTRRAGESIVIGDDVRVVVLDVRGDTVRLGIDAPRSVQVHRAEVYAEVQAANAAAVTGVDDLGPVATRLRRMARPGAGKSAGTTPDAAAPGRPEPAAPEPPVTPVPTPAPTPAPDVEPRPKPGPPPNRR
jgi:carbon storage regulator